MKFGKILKRFTYFLLSGAMLLTACTKNPAPTESEDSGEESGERRYTPVSIGKPYTVSTPASESYSDLFGQQLTDGQKINDEGSFYTDVRMVGFTDKLRVDIDLGDDGKRLVAMSARSLDLSRDGVMLALTAAFYTSDDNKSWHKIGQAAFRRTGDQTMSTARYELSEPIDSRYVRVMITKQQNAGFFFTDEVEIFADVPAKEAYGDTVKAYNEEDIDRNFWKQLSTGKSAAPVVTENVARGANYIFEKVIYDERSKEANRIAKDQPINTKPTEFDKLLTDGARTSRVIGEPVWVGVKAENAPVLKVPFDSEKDNIYAVRAYMSDAGVDINLPDYIDVYAISGGKEVVLGRMYSAGKTGNFMYELRLPEYIKASAVRLKFPAGNGNYWIEEVEVLAGASEKSPEELYPLVNYEKVTEDKYWQPTESDYTEYKNLLLGKQQQIDVSFCMDIPRHGDETPVTAKMLTDGKLASNDECYNGEFFFHRGGGAIDFYFDLDALSSVDKLKLYYLEHLAYGINHPQRVAVYLSENAKDWYFIKSEKLTHEATVDPTRRILEIDFGAAYQARFVRVRVESSFLFADEIELYGTKQIKGTTKKLSSLGVKPVVYYTNDEDRTYSTLENTPIKASDIALVYGEKGNSESLLPLVAYIDENGKIKDTFMDGFLYCPTGGMPSGAGAYVGTKKIDWDTLFENTFNGINGFNRLEEVVGDVKKELGKDDHKVQVYITLLYLNEDVTDFGDIDGDEVTESTVTPEGRRKVIDWYIKRCADEFASRGYQNLELGGFYNIHEAFCWSKDDEYIVREFSEAVHDAGYPYLWIPYYEAYKAVYGPDMDFDLICTQPNYAFDIGRELHRFTSTARRMKNIGGCIEIENSYQSLSDKLFARSYMLYLYYGVTEGYMKDTVHVYYDDLYNFSDMAYSNSELCRMQYDATYHFRCGDLEITPEKRGDVNIEGGANTVISGSVASDDALCNYTVSSAPKHGYIALANDGSFRYYPDKGYTGEDTFTYTYNKFLGESEECVVKINIK